jgi:hypothetical protein
MGRDGCVDNSRLLFFHKGQGGLGERHDQIDGHQLPTSIRLPDLSSSL